MPVEVDGDEIGGWGGRSSLSPLPYPIHINSLTNNKAVVVPQRRGSDLQGVRLA